MKTIHNSNIIFDIKIDLFYKRNLFIDLLNSCSGYLIAKLAEKHEVIIISDIAFVSNNELVELNFLLESWKTSLI